LNGKPVDWFVAYKLPVLDDNGPQFKDGLNFLYADSKSRSWTISDKKINDPNSAIGATLNQLWTIKDDNKIFYALYNDENPYTNKTDSYRAHMKGVLAFDSNNGFWMIHSVPKFLNLKSDKYSYPETGTKNGQSFLCVTFPIASLKTIGIQLQIAQPSVYDYHLPTTVATMFPEISKVVGMKKYTGKTTSSVKTIPSLGGTGFTSFSKNRKFGKDLYGDFVAPELRNSFYVESWLNGAGSDLVSYCNLTYKTYNLRSVKLDSRFVFNSSKDHSKWAVSTENKTPTVCIGDINRQKSQVSRGGGTVCLNNQVLWGLYRSSVGTPEPCPTNATSSGASRVPNTCNVSFVNPLMLIIFVIFIKM